MIETSRLSDAYSYITEEIGVSALELYVYSLIVQDDRMGSLNSRDIYNIIQEAINIQSMSDEPISQIIDRLLDGDEFDGDDDSWY